MAQRKDGTKRMERDETSQSDCGTVLLNLFLYLQSLSSSVVDFLCSQHGKKTTFLKTQDAESTARQKSLQFKHLLSSKQQIQQES